MAERDTTDNYSGRNKTEAERYNKDTGHQGTGKNYIEEPVPNYNRAPIDTVISNKNGWIVLGGDGLASPLSGFAGAGFKESSAIDIVVGRKAGTKEGQPANDTIVDADTFNDAARIYITQRGHVDNYFGIADGKYTDEQSDTVTKSAVVAKADHVRVFGREGVKIVTGNSKNRGGQRESNSNGSRVDRVGTIELIAGNYTQKGFLSRREILQPVIKGDNLVELLNELIEEVSSLNSRTIANSASIAGIATLLGVIPPLTIPAGVVAGVANSNVISGIVATLNFGGMQSNFLKPTGATYINSTHVFAT